MLIGSEEYIKIKENFFARMGVDPETIINVYPEYLLSAKEHETFKQERNSCIIGSEALQNNTVLR